MLQSRKCHPAEHFLAKTRVNSEHTICSNKIGYMLEGEFASFRNIWTFQNKILVLMQGTDLLTSLPVCLSCRVLQGWLGLKSIIALNTAYCSKSLRPSFLTLLQANEYFIVEELVDLDETLPLQVYQKFGQKLRSITFWETASSLQLSAVAAHCHNLIHVHFKGIDTCRLESWDIIHANPKLERVSFSTKCIQYSCSPGNFPSYDEVQSNNFRLFARRYLFDSDRCLEVLKMNKYIDRLNLYCINVNHALLLQLPELCPHLTALGLQGTVLTDRILSVVTASCFNLVHLDISCTHVSDDGIREMAQNLKGLKSLNIQENGSLTDASLVHIYTNCAKTLHTLYLTCYESKYSSFAINEVIDRCAQLRTIGITADYAYLTGIKNLFSPSISKLTSVVLYGRVFNDANIASIGQYGINLEVLCIPELGCYTSEILLCLFDGCPKLKCLCVNVARREELVLYAEENPNIREFVHFALKLWKRYRPGLHVIEKEQDIYPVEYDVMTA